MGRLQSNIGVFQKVGECLYRYSSGGVYYARIRVDGKEIKRSLETTDRAIAQRELARFQGRAASDWSLARQADAGQKSTVCSRLFPTKTRIPAAPLRSLAGVGSLRPIAKVAATWFILKSC